MMRRPVARAAAALLVLGATWSVTLGGTASAWVATTTTASNSFTAAADWIAPTASDATVGRSGAYNTGFIKQAATYYVYANIGDPATRPAARRASRRTSTQ